MGTRYYHTSKTASGRTVRTSNGPGTEMLRVAFQATGVMLMLAVALVCLVVAGLAWIVTWGHWDGAPRLAGVACGIASAATTSRNA